MKKNINIDAVAHSLKQHLFPTEENSLFRSGLSSNIYAQATSLCEEIANLDVDCVGVRICRQIAKAGKSWHSILSDKQAWAIAYAVDAAVKNGKIDAENFNFIIHFEEEEKVVKIAKKVKKCAVPAKNWRKPNGTREQEDVAAICAVGNRVESPVFGLGTVLANDGINATIEFGRGVKKLVLAFLAGRISAVA